MLDDVDALQLAANPQRLWFLFPLLLREQGENNGRQRRKKEKSPFPIIGSTVFFACLSLKTGTTKEKKRRRKKSKEKKTDVRRH